MDCKFCGSPTKVVDSRLKLTSTYRRRECLECRMRFSTIEIDQEVYDGMTSGHATSVRMDVVTFADGRQPIVKCYKIF